MFRKTATAQQMVLSLRGLRIVNKEGIGLNRVKVNVGEISLNASDYDRVQKLLKNWNMNMEELCRYAIMSIANTHHSKRAEALLEYEAR